ncbi:L-threonylcarbamoyladenylate synthase [Hominifimenecus sp. rT4P-3]|uniref:L-threonylcarbamoyladenylate synthase n=1 Tax=Hominifimenecus sp. rT4P-3 TaxID=3242979 RepID=UPI003DA5C855
MNTEICPMTTKEERCPAIQRAARLLREGKLVAFPTETVYGLGGNGLDPQAASRIYAAKGRPSDNPLILHICDREELPPLVRRIPEAAKRLMDAFWPGPLTLIFEKSEKVPLESTGGLDTVAIRFPSHPVAQELIREAGVPIAAPSANLSGRPSPTTAEHVIQDLSGRIEMILDGGPVEIGLESTIIDVTGEIPLILRPGYISLVQLREVLGSGEFDPAILGKPDSDLRPRAPGMKYRHYAPKAELTIVEGKPEAVASRILSLAKEKKNQGFRVGILCSEESRGRYDASFVKTIGTRAKEETIAHNLYRCLREFDEEEKEFVYSEAFSEGPLGAAIMNRLMKAAGYRILQAGGEDENLP